MITLYFFWSLAFCGVLNDDDDLDERIVIRAKNGGVVRYFNVI
jgi:hypothetical protein